MSHNGGDEETRGILAWSAKRLQARESAYESGDV